MDAADFPANTVSPRLDTLIHDGSNRNSWVLAGKWWGTDYAIMGPVKTLNHERGKAPEDTIFMLKFLPFTLNDEEKAMRELQLQHKASIAGLSPIIIDSWTTPTGIAIVMNKLELDVGELLTSYHSHGSQHLIMTSVKVLISKLHRAGIYHGDISFTNLMVSMGNRSRLTDDISGLTPEDPTLEVVRYKNAGYRFYIIDFGEGGLIGTDFSKVKSDYIRLEEDVGDLLTEFPSEALRNVYDCLVVAMETFE